MMFRKPRKIEPSVWLDSFGGRCRRLWRWGLYGVLGALGSSAVLVLLLRWCDPPTTSWRLQRAWQAWWDSSKALPQRQTWVDYNQMAPTIKLAVIASEDQLFPEHGGFDWEAIQKAFSRNQKSKRIRGASTISQQVAKNLFLWPGRNFVRKGLEAYFTLLIEAFWSKQRILEVYLNIAEWGDQLFGVEAASQVYFRRPARALTREQAAILAAVLPNPLRYSVVRPSAYIQNRKAWILQQMNALGISYLQDF